MKNPIVDATVEEKLLFSISLFVQKISLKAREKKQAKYGGQVQSVLI